MAQEKAIISARYLENASFMRDLRRLLQLPTETVSILASALGPSLRRSIEAKDVTTIAKKGAVDEQEVRRALNVIVYLGEQARVLGRSPEDVLAAINSAFSTEENPPSVDPELAKVFAYTDGQRRETLARRVFASPPTYVWSTIRPVLTAEQEGGVEIHLGCYWTISYVDSNGEERSITFGMSAGELDELTGLLQAALESVERLGEAAKRLQTEEP